MELSEQTTEKTAPAQTSAPDPGDNAPPAVMPPSERPQTGREREQLLLTPVEVDNGKSVYRQVLPGIMQSPAGGGLALARESSRAPMPCGCRLSRWGA